MAALAIPVLAPTTVPVAGSSGAFPVRRIYCVGRNYVDHIREMKEGDERDPPFFFQKPTDAIVPHGATVAYPQDTDDFQFEIELVAALGAGGRNIPAGEALGCVYGYAVGIDLTRRDRQREMREKMLSWERGKAFDASAPVGTLVPVSAIGHPAHGAITLAVNGEVRQRGDLSRMIWAVPEIIANLSTSYALAPGDLIMTGTPAGVGPLVPGDRVLGRSRASARCRSPSATARADMLPTERLTYSAIAERPPLKGPGGARTIVWVIVNVEEWDPTETMPRTVLTPPAGGAPMPDIPNWAWHEYGNRVGFWRMLDVFDRASGCRPRSRSTARRSRPTSRSPAPPRSANWEFIGHGFGQKNMQKVAGRARGHPARPRTRSGPITGRDPRGWLGPGLTETWETPDLLVEEGFDYVCDWVLDDQPVVLKTRTKPILNVPYTQECNDVAMMLIQHHKATEYRDRAIDQFEQIHADARSTRPGSWRWWSTPTSWAPRTG